MAFGVIWVLYSLAVFAWVSVRTIEVLVKSRRNSPSLFQFVFTIVFFVATQLLALLIISTVAMGGGLSGLPLAFGMILAQSLSLVFVPELGDHCEPKHEHI
jgi:hypothetical protein